MYGGEGALGLADAREADVARVVVLGGHVDHAPVSFANFVSNSVSSFELSERKARLFAAQGPEDFAVLNVDDPQVAALSSRLASELVPFSTDVASLRNGFARVDAFGSTALHDAVAAR